MLSILVSLPLHCLSWISVVALCFARVTISYSSFSLSLRKILDEVRALRTLQGT